MVQARRRAGGAASLATVIASNGRCVAAKRVAAATWVHQAVPDTRKVMILRLLVPALITFPTGCRARASRRSLLTRNTSATDIDPQRSGRSNAPRRTRVIYLENALSPSLTAGCSDDGNHSLGFCDSVPRTSQRCLNASSRGRNKFQSTTPRNKHVSNMGAIRPLHRDSRCLQLQRGAAVHRGMASARLGSEDLQEA